MHKLKNWAGLKYLLFTILSFSLQLRHAEAASSNLKDNIKSDFLWRLSRSIEGPVLAPGDSQGRELDSFPQVSHIYFINGSVLIIANTNNNHLNAKKIEQSFLLDFKTGQAIKITPAVEDKILTTSSRYEIQIGQLPLGNSEGAYTEGQSIDSNCRSSFSFYYQLHDAETSRGDAFYPVEVSQGLIPFTEEYCYEGIAGHPKLTYLAKVTSLLASAFYLLPDQTYIVEFGTVPAIIRINEDLTPDTFLDGKIKLVNAKVINDWLMANINVFLGAGRPRAGDPRPLAAFVQRTLNVQ